MGRRRTPKHENNLVQARKRAQAHGCAPPPQVAEHRAKTTLFARCTLGRAWMPGSSVLLKRFKLISEEAPATAPGHARLGERRYGLPIAHGADWLAAAAPRPGASDITPRS